MFAGGGALGPPAGQVSYKDYFLAARSFLQQNGCAVIRQAVAAHLSRSVKLQEISEVRIYLEKHGQFYHPARIDIRGRAFTAAFVLNVAVSETGRTWIETEFNTLRTLNETFAGNYLPAVFARGEVPVKGSAHSLPLFLGEWFDGYHEFHLSQDPKNGENRIFVWDYGKGDYFISSAQAVELFRQAAFILTFYYNPQTFEQIFSWHHAAGDFVVKLQEGRMNVRLVAARQYLKLFRHSEGAAIKATFALKALLIFFLQLSIRMRLDRLDGTGSVVWLGREALTGTLKGVFDALALKPPLKGLPVPLIDGFRAYLYTLTEKDLRGLLDDIAATYSPASPDIHIIKTNLGRHAAELYQAIHSDGTGCRDHFNSRE